MLQDNNDAQKGRVFMQNGSVDNQNDCAFIL